MTISFIVAAAENNVIGNNNQLPWRLPNDLKYFKNTTWGLPVIMGRKTFESFKSELAGRTNIVITRQPGWTAPGVIMVNTMEQAVDAARETDAKACFVIGGAEIFKQFLPQADMIYLTLVHAVVEGDTFFPPLPASDWRLVSNLDMPGDQKHAFSYSFQRWERIREDGIDV